MLTHFSGLFTILYNVTNIQLIEIFILKNLDPTHWRRTQSRIFQIMQDAKIRVAQEV